MIDFTLEVYCRLLDSIKCASYSVQTFCEFIKHPQKMAVILRHDVDRCPQNSLRFARFEYLRGLRSSYYFRIVPESYDTKIINQIKDLGHEIGYHYEDMNICKGNVEAAWKSFKTNLARIREIVPVQTACMHGSPLSRFDNRDLWKKFDYRDGGIIGEPYFDIDFSRVFYLSDTGRRWNHKDASLRDKVESPFQIKIQNTNHLIQLIREGRMPDQMMINTHPQRWNDNLIPWTRELVWQSSKNYIKKILVKW